MYGDAPRINKLKKNILKFILKVYYIEKEF